MENSTDNSKSEKYWELMERMMLLEKQNRV
jgi:hypothetical protein